LSPERSIQTFGDHGDVPASLSPPSHAKHGTVCDQGVIPPWIPRQLWLAKAVMVRYYGLYANAHRGKVRKASLASSPLTEAAEKAHTLYP